MGDSGRTRRDRAKATARFDWPRQISLIFDRSGTLTARKESDGISQRVQLEADKATVAQPNKIWQEGLVGLIMRVKFSKLLAGLADWWWLEEA